MGAALELNNNIVTTDESHKHTAIFIGGNDQLNIALANQLQENFETTTRIYSKLQLGLDYLMDHSCSLLIINLDAIDKHAFERIEKLVEHKQVATIVFSHNPRGDEEFNIAKDHPYIEFVITSTLSKHFVKSVDELLKRCGQVMKLKARLQKVSVTSKPKSFYLLAALLLLEPIIKIFYMKISTGFDFDVVFRTIFSIEGIITNFEFWFMFPLAGVALISQKSWSFAVFMMVQVYSLFSLFYYTEFTWPYVADSPHMSASFLILLNTAVVLYFLVPEHRRPFWNRSQKLWRNTSRYATNLPIFFTNGRDKSYTSITNISKSGAYFMSNENIAVGEKTKLQFFIAGKVHEVEATVKRTHQTEQSNQYGYGVEFDSLPTSTKEVLTEYIESLEMKLQ